MKKTDKYILGVFILGIILFLNIPKIQPVVDNKTANTHFKARDTDVAFGLDVSEYQGKINHITVDTQSKHPIEFVIIRATKGVDVDKRFNQNWKGFKKTSLLIGAYHYYRPNENSIKQAKNYCRIVKLKKGNFIPIVDIENESSIQTMQKLKLGLKKWLDYVEKEYGVKPIIYTSQSFFQDHLEKDFSDYPLWVAAYNPKKRADNLVKNAAIHQFSEEVHVPGIKENTVDGNDIKRVKLDDLILR